MHTANEVWRVAIQYAEQFVTGLQAGGFRRGGVCIPSTTRPQTLPFRAGWRVFRPEGRGFKPGRNSDKTKSGLPRRYAPRNDDLSLADAA
jgi:hypothetical protein